MTEWFEIQEVLRSINSAKTLAEAQHISKKYLLDVDAKIREYENHLEHIHRNGLDSEISF